MANYKIGYGKPPRDGRFKPGVSGNPKGRPKRRPAAIAEIINEAIDRPIEYREGGRTKFASTRELSLRMLVSRAVDGDIEAAEIAIKIRERAERFGDAGVDQIEVSGWLADYFGQTAEQKNRDSTAGRDAPPAKWWASSEDSR